MKSLPLLFILCFFAFLQSCHTTTPDKPVTPTSTDTIKQYGTPFASVPEPNNAIIYQVNIRAFGPQGNFAGILPRLDSMKKLGVNVIYLMPIYPVGSLRSVNSPYCVRDYTSVNKEFGTLTDLRAIVDQAHSLNMAVMLDWVANHTSWDNAWITSHPSWYVQNSSGQIQSPATYTDVAQLDFTNQAMRLQMIQDMKYWVLTANIDGFRCDYADNQPADFWTQAIDTLKKISSHKLLMLAEGTQTSHYTSGFDYIFGFNYYGSLKSVFGGASVKTTIDNVNATDSQGIAGEEQVVRYLTNHDVNSSDGTPLDLFGGKTGSMAAFVVTAYMKGIPFVYNGQEVAFPTRIVFPFTSVKIDWTKNPDVTAEYKKVIAFRNSSDAIKKGVLTSYSSADVCAFTKVFNDETVVVISNLRNKSVSFDITGTPLVNSWTDAFTGNPVTLSSTVDLSPYSYLVLKN